MRILFILVAFSISISLGTQDLVFTAATKEKREKYRLEMQKTISSEIKLYNSKQRENSIKKSLEYMQILNYLEDDGYYFLKLTLKDYPSKSENFYNNILETVFTLYETGFEEEMENILNTTKNPRHFSFALNFLLRIYPEIRQNALKTLQNRFKNYQKDPLLRMLAQYLEVSHTEYFAKRPPLKDLLSNDYGENNYILFSLQRKNRDYPGLLLIKKPDGNFYRREDGSIFFISQLARSVSNLPSYMVNGNTPQGIFSIQKIQTVQSEVIGPTPAIITALPYEVSFNKFFHLSTKNKKWDLNSYLNFLPSSWRNYFPIQEAYISGEIGRNGIYAHGTTVDTEFYKDYIYYPNTPTRGCLSAKEIWSKKTGKSLYSDQIFLLDALKNMEPANGYMIVIELNEREIPVSLDEVIMDILDVEENSKLILE